MGVKIGGATVEAVIGEISIQIIFPKINALRIAAVFGERTVATVVLDVGQCKI